MLPAVRAVSALLATSMTLLTPHPNMDEHDQSEQAPGGDQDFPAFPAAPAVANTANPQVVNNAPGANHPAAAAQPAFALHAHHPAVGNSMLSSAPGATNPANPPPAANFQAAINPSEVHAGTPSPPVAARQDFSFVLALAPQRATNQPAAPSVPQAPAPRRRVNQSSGARWTPVETQALLEGHADPAWTYPRMIREDPRLRNRSRNAARRTAKRAARKNQGGNGGCNPDSILDGNNHGPNPPPGPGGPPFGGDGFGSGGLAQAPMIQTSSQHS